MAWIADGDDRRLSTKKERKMESNGPKAFMMGLPLAGPSYTNTESRRLGGLESQRIRAAKLEAYINNDGGYEPADKTFGMILAGTFLFSLILGLLGAVLYYGKRSWTDPKPPALSGLNR